MSRQTERNYIEGPNPMYRWYRYAPFWRSLGNFLVIYLCRFLPWPGVKNFLFRLIGMKVGRNVSFALMTMVDIFFPELISVGDNSVIGYNTTILTHEFLIKEWRKGPVVIGQNVLIGANSTILAGVTIGDGAVIGAMSLVNRDVPAGAVVGGVPIRELSRTSGEGAERTPAGRNPGSPGHLPGPPENPARLEEEPTADAQ